MHARGAHAHCRVGHAPHASGAASGHAGHTASVLRGLRRTWPGAHALSCGWSGAWPVRVMSLVRVCLPRPVPSVRVFPCPPSSVHGEREAASARQPRARSTFLSWEVSSHSLASLAAELPEDKRSDYKANQGQERCQGEKKPRL